MTDRLADAIRELVAEAVRMELVAQRDAPTAPRLLSVPAAAAALGLSRGMFYRLIATGAIRTLTVGRRRLVPESAIRAYIERASPMV